MKIHELLSLTNGYNYTSCLNQSKGAQYGGLSSTVETVLYGHPLLQAEPPIHYRWSFNTGLKCKPLSKQWELKAHHLQYREEMNTCIH